MLPEILVNRAGVHVLVDNITAASADYRAAIDAADKPTAYATQAVAFFLHHQDFANAWEFLPYLDPNTKEGKFLTAITEFHNTDDAEEHSRYLQQIKGLADEDWPVARLNVACILFNWLFW